MNCQHCYTPIDYRYPTVCPNCDSELPPNEPFTECLESSNLLDPSESKRTFGIHVANAFFVLMTSFAGTILGAIGMYVVGALVYLIFVSGPPGTHSCGTGNIVSSFTNSNVKSLIRLEGGTNSMVLNYTSIRNKAKNTTTTYKSEVTRSGNSVALVVTDFATGASVSKDTFPTPTPHEPGGTTFDSLEDCIKDFDCKHKGALQCEANSTCQDQFAALTCCLKTGQCFSVHLIIRPTSLRCLLRPWVTKFEGFVLRTQ